MHQGHVHHGGLVDDQQLAVERVLGITLEAAALGIDFEQSVNGLRLEACRLRHALGGAACRRTEQKVDALCGEDTQDGIDDGGLAHTGAAGDDQQLCHERKPDRLSLARRKAEAGLLLDPGQRLVGVDPGPGQLVPDECPQALGNCLLGSIEPGEEYTARLAHGIGDDGALGKLEIQRSLDEFLRHIQQFDRQRRQFFDRQAAVTLVHGFRQRIGNSGAHPDHGRLLDPKFHGNGVRRSEADAADVAGQPVGVVGHHLDGVGAIGLVDAHCTRRPHAIAVQEHHDLPDRLLLGPSRRDALSPYHAYAIDLAQSLGIGLDDVEDLLTEGLYHLLRIDRANAPDHSRGEVLLDSLRRGGRRRLQKPCLEL